MKAGRGSAIPAPWNHGRFLRIANHDDATSMVRIVATERPFRNPPAFSAESRGVTLCTRQGQDAGMAKTPLADGLLERKITRAIREALRGETGMKAWTGKRGAAHVVYWNDPTGKRRQKACGEGSLGRALATQEAARIHSELTLGTYGSNAGKTWAEFRREYARLIVATKAPPTQVEIDSALDVFERLADPTLMADVTTQAVDGFIMARGKEQSQRHPGQSVSPATVNKELRHLKAAFKRAEKWGFLVRMPEVTMVREARTIPSYVTPDHFQALYAVADDWWRGLLVTAYMTGWRIGQLLRLRCEDFDLVEGWQLSRAADGKGKRDKRKPLHPLVIEHLRPLQGGEFIFPWPHCRRYLDVVWHQLCDRAGVPRYGFHDLRRAFATMNADRMTADALQEWMEHRSHATTQRYIAVARQIKPAMEALYVPPTLRVVG